MNLFSKQKQTHGQKTNLWLPKGKGGNDILEVWDKHIHTTISKTDKQEGHTIQHRELY